MRSTLPVRAWASLGCTFFLASCASLNPPPKRLPSHWPHLEPAASHVRERIQEWKQGQGGVQVLHPILQRGIDRLRATSPTFYRAWDYMQQQPIPILIGTDSQLGRVLPGWLEYSSYWAGLQVSYPLDSRNRPVQRAAILIRLDWLYQQSQFYHNTEAQFMAALDYLLVHEVYGHLVPVLQHGFNQPGCPDPFPGQPPETVCVNRRIQFVLHEILGRSTAGIDTVAPAFLSPR